MTVSATGSAPTGGIGYMGGVCGDSCFGAALDVAGASLPLVGVAAAATMLFGAVKFCKDRMNIANEGKRQAQDLHIRDMRQHRQDSASTALDMSMMTIGTVAFSMIMAIITALPALGTMGGLSLMALVGGGAVVVTNLVHERLAPHDGRANA